MMLILFVKYAINLVASQSINTLANSDLRSIFVTTQVKSQSKAEWDDPEKR